MRILVLEDEFLIAMDVEQLCRDNGAADVVIAQDLTAIDPEQPGPSFDAAILDIMLGGISTLPFARKLHERGVPFIFASGYTDFEEILAAFPGVLVIGKPYSGDELIEAVAAASGRLAASGSA
ncbi:response regulator [Pseudaminobacter arsenicus]|uniref:Response regulator n=2 Tax=Borborobacter arsenicus TaxID=1851146 RepID=A0A432V6L8_9HYPH|nr:response regulator [Pseudaminobacter arsenicus]